MGQMDGLEALLIEQLTPKILEVTDEHVKSEEVIQLLHEGLKELTLERINNTLDEEYVCHHMVKNVTPEVKSVVRDFIEEIGVTIRTVQVVLNDEPFTSSTEVYHKDYEAILRFALNRVPVLLKGPAGGGKNICVEQVAEALKLPLYRCNSPQDKFELEGFIDANGRYVEKPFYNAFTKGGVLLLDEIDTAMPSALISINDAIGNGAYEFPNGKAKMHENFVVIATANTWGNGKSFEYIGRNKLDAASLDRFAFWEFMYDKDLERVLYPDEEILEVFWQLRNAADRNKTRAIFSMRGIKYSYKLRKSGMDLDKIIKSCVIKGLNVDDLNVLIKDLDISEYDNMFYKALHDVRDEMCR
ncbi:MAG: AAA family ATPase [Clostridia bacterium]|nr:AAA family ATPase [Clostridia bacterium]